MSKFFTRFTPPPSPSVSAKGGLTQQHFKDECDLNTILKRYLKSGIPPPVQPGIYADLTEMPSSLAEAFDRVFVAQEWFDSLPSDVRRSFDNDPRLALRLVMSNPSEAVKRGLLPVDVVPTNLSTAVKTAAPEPQREAAVANPSPAPANPSPAPANPQAA